MWSKVLGAFFVLLVACVCYSRCQYNFNPEYAQVFEEVMRQNHKLLDKTFMAGSPACDRLIATTRVYIREYRRMRIRPLSLRRRYMSALRNLLRV